MIAIYIFVNKYKSFEKKSSKVFRYLKMTVLLKDPKGRDFKQKIDLLLTYSILI